MKILNTKDSDEGVLTIHGLIEMLPTEDQIKAIAENDCDKNAEAYVPEYYAYIRGMTDLVNSIKNLNNVKEIIR